MTAISRRRLRTGAGSAAAVGVAALLLGISVAAGLRVPSTQHLSGYPPAAQLESDRPPAGFAPLTQRFISEVLGLPTGARRDTAATPVEATPAVRGGDRARGGGPGETVPRLSVSHPFGNDSFDGAYTIPAVPFTARTTTVSATREPGESTACAPIGGTAWYRYTAVADERLLALTLGSNYALSLGVFTGDRVDRLQRVGCDNGPTGNAQVGFRAKRGVTYYFQVADVAGGRDLVFALNPVGSTRRVSVSSSGAQSDNGSYLPSISADGRFVGFNSTASNLTPDQHPCSNSVPAATSCISQVFVHDRVGHITSLVSVSSSGEPADGGSSAPSLSRDGRYVAFHSAANNLVRGATLEQVYVRDRVTGITRRVSEPASGEPGGGGGFAPAISDDGRYIAFLSTARDLISEPPPPCETLAACPVHVYVRDLVMNETTLVSGAHNGGYADGGTFPPSMIQPARPTISAEGRYVAFHSEATDLVPGDTNGRTDVFVHDRRTRRTELVSISGSGTQGDEDSFGSSSGGRYVSAGGRYVAFWSDATDLVPGDTNETSDFFVRDLVSGTTTRVSVSSAGAQGHAPPTAPTSTAGGVALSDDGRFVAFDSALVDLADDARTGPLQVYIRDIAHGVTSLGSVTSLGDSGDWHSMMPAFSARGEALAFSSTASNLVADDDNRGCVAPFNTRDSCSDIFVHEPVPAP